MIVTLLSLVAGTLTALDTTAYVVLKHGRVAFAMRVVAEGDSGGQ
ncbi:MAG: hypothetical protein ABJD07_11065 [Gemmatimonadaceae bacterium]